MNPDEFDWTSEAGDPYQGYQEAEYGGAAATPTSQTASAGLGRIQVALDAAERDARRAAAALRDAQDRDAQAMASLRGLDDKSPAYRESFQAWLNAGHALSNAEAEYKQAQAEVTRYRSQLAQAQRSLDLRTDDNRPKTEAELAKEAYDKRLYEARLADLDQYGLEGRPRPQTPPMSSPSAMMAAQEQAASGQFERQTKFPWEKEKWEKDYEFDTGTKFPFEVRKHEETQQYNQARLAQDKLLREMEDRENWRRAQLNTAEGLYGTNANVFTKMAAAAPLPGQQYHLGYEPGGTMENIARLSGRAYNPELYRIGIQTFDPEEAWRRAQQMVGNRG